MKSSYQYFNAHANGAMQCMTSLLPINPKKGSEGCNHIATSQCALLYRYLPHQSGYGLFICIFNMRVQMYDCNAWTSYTSKLYNFKSNATSRKIYKFTNKAKFRSYLASVSFWNLMEAIQITKLKRVDHIAMFTCLHRRLRTWAKHDPKVHHLFTNISQHQNKHTLE